MKKYKLPLILACLIALSPSVYAQDDDSELEEEFIEERVYEESSVKCSAAGFLKKLYGNVIVESDKDPSVVNLTLSVPRGEIESMLNMSLTDGWYPKSLVIQSVGDGNNVAVYLKLSKRQNDSPRHFRVLGKLCAPGVLPWKPLELDDKDAYVTHIETDFGEDFLVKGETVKSGLIFKNLSPKIRKIGADLENLDSERFASKNNFDRSKMFTRETYSDNDTGINGQPFFERGTYKENSKVGRYMVFTLRCKW